MRRFPSLTRNTLFTNNFSYIAKNIFLFGDT